MTKFGQYMSIPLHFLDPIGEFTNCEELERVLTPL